MPRPTRLSKKVLIFVLLFLAMALIAACHLVGQSNLMKNPTMKDHVTFLADPRLEGRNSGTPGNVEAANYIADYFKSFGLLPMGRTFKQSFEVATGVERLPDNTVSITQKDGTVRNLQLEVDFTPIGLSGNATDLNGEMVFAGFGISQKSGDYNDYSSLDVAGKIVVLFRGTPDSKNPHSKFQEYAPIRYKLSNARAQEAAAVILISSMEMSDSLMNLSLPIGGVNLGIPTVHMRRHVIEDLLPEGLNLELIENRINQQRKPQTVALNASATMSVNLEFIFKKTANVIGYVPGTNPALVKEYIVVGAHFDHIGFGEYGSRYNGTEKLIHPGADDNASGTSGVLELAARTAKTPLPRPVIFMGFSGEEMGLLGSAFYTREPLVPISETITMINMDMIGRLRQKALTVTGTGTSSHWDSLIDSLGALHELNISKSSGGFGSSDHSSFFSQDIPVINFFTGLHDDYHRPEDTMEKLNYNGMDSIINMVAATLNHIAHMEERPDFIKPKNNPRSGRMSFRVRVGTIPDYVDHPKGLRITGVQPDSPAEKSGLKGGDVITSFGTQKIENIYDYTYVLGVYSPGDTVTVKILRGEEETPMEMPLILEARGSGS